MLLVLRFGFKPARDVGGESKFGQRFLHQRFQFGANFEPVDFGGGLRRIPGKRLALDEAPFDGKERRQDVVARLELQQFGLDAEKFADKIFQVGRELNDEFRAAFGVSGRWLLARGQ